MCKNIGYEQFNEDEEYMSNYIVFLVSIAFFSLGAAEDVLGAYENMFLVTIVGIDFTIAALIFTLGTVADSVISPLLGYLVDHWVTSLGSFRHWMIMFAAPASTLLVAFFWNLGPNTWYYSSIYMGMKIAFVCLKMPLSGFMYTITMNNNTITKLVAIRGTMSNVAAVVVGGLLLGLTLWLSFADVLFYVVIGVSVFIILAFTLAGIGLPRSQSVPASQGWKDVWDLCNSVEFRRFIVVFFPADVVNRVSGFFAYFYLVYALHLDEGWYNLMIIGATVVGIPIWLLSPRFLHTRGFSEYSMFFILLAAMGSIMIILIPAESSVSYAFTVMFVTIPYQVTHFLAFVNIKSVTDDNETIPTTIYTIIHVLAEIAIALGSIVANGILGNLTLEEADLVLRITYAITVITPVVWITLIYHIWASRHPKFRF